MKEWVGEGLSMNHPESAMALKMRMGWTLEEKGCLLFFCGF